MRARSCEIEKSSTCLDSSASKTTRIHQLTHTSGRSSALLLSNGLGCIFRKMKVESAGDKFRTEVSSKWTRKRLEIQSNDNAGTADDGSSKPSSPPSPINFSEDGHDGRNKRALIWRVESLHGMRAPASRKIVTVLCAEHHLNQHLAPPASHLSSRLFPLFTRTWKIAPCGTMGASSLSRAAIYFLGYSLRRLWW